MIGSLKYDGSAHAAQIAADLLADYLREEIAAERAFSKKQVLIAPVPLHTRRQRERGFNQIERVLALLPADMREGPLAALAPSLLLRARETLQQARLSRQERLSNVAGAFSLAGTAPERGTRVFLVDDVATTGATLVNAAAPLKRAGARVFLIALARA